MWKSPTTDPIAHAIDGLSEIENGVCFRQLEQIVEYDRREGWKVAPSHDAPGRRSG